MVGGGAQELVDQVAIGAVDFHAVEAGVDGIACGRRKSSTMAAISARSSAGRRAGDHAAHAGGVVDLPDLSSKGSADGATGSAPSWKSGCDMRPTCHSCRKMRPPAGAPHGDQAPATNLLLAVDAWVKE
jgi:hypothetical protein